MLIRAGQPLGLNISVLAENSKSPASQVTNSATLGSIAKNSDLKRLMASKLSHLTFESEFVDAENLKRILPRGVKVFPNLNCISVIQDRLSQKKLLDQFEVPTANWAAFDGNWDRLRNRFQNGFVLKARRGGYDGNGTWVVKKTGRLPTFEKKFIRNPGLIAEELIPFERELATSYVRSSQGEFVELPLVETYQFDSRCDWVKGPVHHKQGKVMAAQFRRLMNELNYVGVLSVEFFEVGSRLLVNELAPRVHNSAHYSIEALSCSQFEYHIRAGLGDKLPKVELRAKGFAMANLIGRSQKPVKLNRPSSAHLHWYGKSENRKGRKLGHLTTLSSHPNLALKQALKNRKGLKL